MSLFRRKKREPSGKPVSIDQPVWFFLVKVEVTGNTKQPWIAGSVAVVQAFAPGRGLEDTLLLLDEALVPQELRRIDTMRAERFEPDAEDPAVLDDFMRQPLERAAATNECVLGVFFVSKEDAWPSSGAWPE